VEEEQTRLNPDTCTKHLLVSANKFIATYIGQGNDYEDAAIQANRPAPCHRPFYYFEMMVKYNSRKGMTSIGFTNEHFKNS
jgi:hypothetical protein